MHKLLPQNLIPQETWCVPVTRREGSVCLGALHLRTPALFSITVDMLKCIGVHGLAPAVLAGLVTKYAEVLIYDGFEINQPFARFRLRELE